MTPSWFFTALAVSCASYLAWRGLLVLLRVRRARHAYLSPGAGAPSTEATFTDAPSSGAPWAQAPSAFHDRCRGALVGGAIGDALGLPAESLPRWLARLRYPGAPRFRRGLVRFVRRAGDISDDTQLTLCVARSIDPSGSYLHARFLDELRLWHGHRIGAGRASSVAAGRLRRDPTAASGVPSEGNGAAMRVAPLSIAHAGDPTPEALLAAVEDNARSTHTAPAAIDGAKLVALLVWHALRTPPGTLSALPLRELLPTLCAQAGFTPPPEVAPPGPPSGHVASSLGAVLRVLSAARGNFATAMALAVQGGGDTDTVAAIAGTILGAQLGLRQLPAEWATRVQHRETLTAHADRLASPRATPCSASASASSPPQGRGLDGAAPETAVVEVMGDVALREVDVVVNAWNRNVVPPWLLLPQGVSRAIRRAGGRAAIRDVSRRGPMPLGSAWETPAYGLRARFVIHVAGIDLLWRASERSVRWSTRHALLLARTLGASSIALPLIGAGSGGLDPKRVRRWMLEEIAAQAHAFDRVELVVPGVRQQNEKLTGDGSGDNPHSADGGCRR